MDHWPGENCLVIEGIGGIMFVLEVRSRSHPGVNYLYHLAKDQKKRDFIQNLFPP